MPSARAVLWARAGLADSAGLADRGGAGEQGGAGVLDGGWVALGDTLRALRRRADLSQRELASVAGVPASTVARIESGSAQDPRYRTMERLVRAAGFTLAVVDGQAETTPVGLISTRSPTPELLDAAGRRYPAHLDVREVRDPRDWGGAWWAHNYVLPPSHWPVDVPAYSYDLCRAERDRRRRRVLAAAGVRIESVDGLPHGAWQLLARTHTNEVIGEVRALLWHRPGSRGLSVTQDGPVRGAREAMLDGLTVVPDCRRAGVGGRLLAAMVETLRQAGVTAVHASDDIGSTDGFVRRRGFRPARRVLRWTMSVDP